MSPPEIATALDILTRVVGINFTGNFVVLNEGILQGFLRLSSDFRLHEIFAPLKREIENRSSRLFALMNSSSLGAYTN
jgi:hypothetical protein